MLTLALWGLVFATTLHAAAAACQSPGEAHRAERRPSDGLALRELGRVRTCSLPKSVALTPDGGQLWVAAFGRRDTENLEVFDAVSLRLLGRVSIRGNPVEVIFDRQGRRAFVSSFAAARVMEIDVATRRVIRELPAGLDPKTMALSPDERLLYVVNWRSNDVSVVDLTSGRELRRLATGRHPRGIVVSPDGRILVATTEGDRVHELRSDGTRLRDLRTCEFPRHLVLAPDASAVHVTCSGASAVVTYRLSDWTRVATARTGRNPRTLAGTSDGRFLAVADYDGRSVTLVDLQLVRRRTIAPRGAGRIVGVAIRASSSPALLPTVYATSWDTRELIAFGPR